MKSDSTSKTPRASESEANDNKEKINRSKASKLDENSSKLKLSQITFYFDSLQSIEPCWHPEKLNQYGKLRNNWPTYR